MRSMMRTWLSPYNVSDQRGRGATKEVNHA